MTVDQQKKPRKRHLPASTDDEEPESYRFGPGLGLRKKGTGVRAWLVLDSAGQVQVLEAGKHPIMRRTGLPGRDLRILDPMLSYPSTVLGRERAIVVNLEHIKAIVTAQEVLLLNYKDPAVAPFAQDLQWRLFRLHQAAKNQEVRGSPDGAAWTALCDLEESQGSDASPQTDAGLPPSHKTNDEQGSKDESQDAKNRDGVEVLPFEFIALEACLEAACSLLENEVRTLEQEAHLALDKLTSKISTLNLERVRQIKSRLVALTGRVQKLRDELEHLLDDGEDMAEMYLTEKLTQRDLENSSFTSMNEQDDADEQGQPETDEREPADIPPEVHGGACRFEGDAAEPRDSNLQRTSLAMSATHTYRPSPTHCGHLDVEELEMLLEAYFAQIDGTLNKLTTLREYVDDTEDYINIMLDDKRNHLLRMGVMLSTASLVLSAFVTVTGIFGMNINIELFDQNKYGDREFLWTIGDGSASTVLLYVVAIIWYKHKHLLE
ncbi:hypothetical protein Cgig2_019510 [Carnegiea gigantea]|uniref:Magnesium transporter n=1 Tax=Carnegiea gigantea TaxID=171969 RepID=A0A9Q1KRH9_9CARY|nr:hypothetical protein Cgig2_019510 [Carnegiea gigantea]